MKGRVLDLCVVRRWSLSLLLLSCACAESHAPAAADLPELGPPLAPYCKTHPCPRDFDDALAHGFVAEPVWQVYPACHGARVIATFTSDTSEAWFFDGASGTLIGREDTSWGTVVWHGRGVALSGCEPRASPRRTE